MTDGTSSIGRDTSVTTTTQPPKTGSIKWVGIALLIIVACIAATCSVLSLGNLIEQARGPSPVRRLN